MNLEVGALEIGIALAVLAGSCSATWFAADAHYSQAMANLQGQLQGAADAQRSAVAEQIAKDGQAAKQVDDEAKSQIGSMSAVIADLSVRSAAHSGNTGRLCAAAPGPAVPRSQPDRPAATGGAGPPAGSPAASPPAPEVSAPGIDLGALNDALELGGQSIKAELLWRQWARQTGAVK